MLTALRALDGLLRGQTATAEALGRTGTPPTAISFRLLVMWAAGLGALYGFFMGWWAISSGQDQALLQALASTVKLPLLFLATLLVTFPSLYVFNALIGCRLSFVATLRLLIGAIVVNLCVGASLGPILGFFTLCTTSYAFIVLLNVGLLGLAGCIGLGFLIRSLRALAREAASTAHFEAAARAGGPARTGGEGEQAATDPAVAADRFDDQQRALRAADGIFRVWIVIYGLVGAQMGWILRPFIGHPNIPFSWFRPRDGHFFQAVLQSVRAVMGW